MKKAVSVLVLVCMIINFLVVPIHATPFKPEEILRNLTLKQKICQMLMMSFETWDEKNDGISYPDSLTETNPEIEKIIADYDFGAIIYFSGNISSVESAYRLTDSLQKSAVKNGGIPLIIATDQEGGKVTRLSTGTALPGNMAIGATNDASSAKLAGKIVGEELSAIGINTALAPVVDVNSNANNPVIGLRSYGDNPEKVGMFAGEFIRGLKETEIIGCAKHFPGHGDTSNDSHYGLPCVDKSYDELIENELKPYKALTESGIDMIMTAHILYPQLEKDKVFSSKTGKYESLPATMSDDILTGILRNTLGFDGVICTDAMNMAGITNIWGTVESAVTAINAGVDMLCMPVSVTSVDEMYKVDNFIKGISDAVTGGKISMERIDDACLRILKLKEKRGILDYNSSKYSLDKAISTVGSQEHKETERKISAESVTVVKNNGILPIKTNQNEKILMLSPKEYGSASINIGWSRLKEQGLIPAGADLEIVSYDSSDIAGYKDKIIGADKIIVVSKISSVSSIKNKKTEYTAPTEFVKFAKEAGKPVIVISADKPYDVQFYESADAIVAVYGIDADTDVTESLTDKVPAVSPNMAAGIEVIFGVFGAKGTLPVNIPEFDFNTFGYTNKTVYENGFGLTFDSLVETVSPINTESEVKITEARTEKNPEKIEVLDVILIGAVVILSVVTVIFIIRKFRRSYR